MKRIIITGGTGFVGANLARHLLRRGHEVHLLVRPRCQHWRIEEIRTAVQCHEVNLADTAGLAQFVRQVRPEWIFHLAAHGAYSWQTDTDQIVQTNVIGTIHLLNACADNGFEAFIHTGSSSEYGFKDHSPAEEELIEPNSCYAVTKAAATLFCRHVARARNLNITTLRLYSAYGPYEDPKRLIPALIHKGLQGELPPLVDPNTPHDFVHVEDVCDACLLAAQTPPRQFGAVYNVGTGVQTTLREVVEVARRVMGIAAEAEWGSMPAREWDTAVWVADSRKISAELGWKARLNFERGFQSLVEWQRPRSFGSVQQETNQQQG